MKLHMTISRKKIGTAGPVLGYIGHDNDIQHQPLQMADLLAYEARYKTVQNDKRNMVQIVGRLNCLMKQTRFITSEQSTEKRPLCNSMITPIPQQMAATMNSSGRLIRE